MEDQGSRQGPPKRKSARYKRELVLELIRGGTIEKIARREGITAKELEEWREQFIKNGEEGFKNRQQDGRLEEARQVIGDLTMENELLKKKIEVKKRTRGK